MKRGEKKRLRIVFAVKLVMDGRNLSVVDSEGIWHLLVHKAFENYDLRRGTAVLKSGFRLLFNSGKKSKRLRTVTKDFPELTQKDEEEMFGHKIGEKVPIPVFITSPSLLKVEKFGGDYLNLCFENKKLNLNLCLPHSWVSSVADLRTGKILYKNTKSV